MFSKVEGQIYFFCGLFIVFLCWLILTLNPQFDLVISQLFYDEVSHFSAAKISAAVFMRKLFIWLMVLFYVGVTYCGLKTYNEQKPLFRLNWNAYAYMGICGLLGPGLLVNSLLKSHWGRSRPRHLAQFGETQDYTQFWQITDQCEKNCSFASGEVTSMAMIFLSLSIVVARPKRNRVLLIGAILTFIVSMMRMSVGAHFFTDCLVGVGLMLMLAPLVYYFFDPGKNSWIGTLNEKQQNTLDKKQLKS